MGTTTDGNTGFTVEMDALPDVGARAFVTNADNPVSLVVWDRNSALHAAGDVWGLFRDGRQVRAGDDTVETATQVSALVTAARSHYGTRLRVTKQQRGLSEFENRLLGNAGLRAA